MPTAKVDWRDKYAGALPSYEAFRRHMDTLLNELIQQSGIRIQVVESRTKTVESFAEKINRPSKNYTHPLEDLPDLVGLRVILYYADDVARVEELLNEEFAIHRAHSSDKRQELSPNEFGYLSVHHVVSLKPPRIELAEWKPYTGMKAEVQIRTVLQHSWAGVSHALQYKHEADVPLPLKRKLFRLAGLFELADEQFMEIRNQHASLEADIAEQIKEKHDKVPLNLTSLTLYMEQSLCVQSAIAFAKTLRYSFESPDFGEEGETRSDYLSRIVRDCKKFGILDLDQLDAALSSHDTAYEAYLEAIQDEDDEKIWYVDDAFILYLILIQMFKSKYSLKGLAQSGWSESIAKRVLKGARNN